MKRRSVIYLILPLILSLSALGGVALGQTPESTAEPEPTPVQTPAVTNEGAAEESKAPVETPQSAPTETEEGLREGRGLEGVIPTRTPVPTPTPGIIQETVSEVAGRVGLDEVSVFGISAVDLIDLVLSLFIILFGYFIGTWVIRRLLPRIARRTATKFDDRLLAVVGSDIRWLVVLFIFQFAVLRLLFLSPELTAIVIDLIFILELVFIIRLAWRLIKFAEQWFTEKAVQARRGQELTPVIKLVVILSRVFGLIIAVSFLLSHFGVDITLFIATLGLGGLALSLGARDLVADLVAGITILIDRPFRIGDRINVEAINAWGDVVDIGLRTTRIRALDNRLIIVPNSSIAQNEVINYSYPDPAYRYETQVGVAYGTDIETARRVMIDTVRQLEEVLEDQPDRPVDALYVEMGDSAMIFRVRWWMASYVDTRYVEDKVHSRIHTALNAAGIQIPFPQRDVHLDITPETANILSANKPDSGNQHKRND